MYNYKLLASLLEDLIMFLLHKIFSLSVFLGFFVEDSSAYVCIHLPNHILRDPESVREWETVLCLCKQLFHIYSSLHHTVTENLFI